LAEITPKLVDFLLYNLPALKEQHEAMMPKSSTSVVVLVQRRGSFGSSVERMVIKRATLSMLVDALERAIKYLPADCRKVYRMKYRAGMRHRQIAKRAYMHERTVDRKVDFIRNAVTQQLQALPGTILDESCRLFVGKMSGK
jgi:DNA-directed RNA polymerase specialized sigma24 family protein